MLKNINPLLGPELLKILRAMGHGDEIAIVDAHYPAESTKAKLVRMDGVAATDVLDAILSVMPLDHYAEPSAYTMQVVGKPEQTPEIVAQFQQLIDQHEAAPAKAASIDRFQFYSRVDQAFAVVATGESRQYGNILVKKGVWLG